MKALLALEDGRTFPCSSFTGPGEAGGEVVFNTSMTGYQEILTDPSYNSQIITMTYPLIGNYGINPVDVESSRIQVAAFLVREYQAFPSNFRSTRTLADYLKDQGVLGLENLDTRALTRHIRNAGAMKAFISTKNLDPADLVEKARKIPDMLGQDLAKTVSTKTPYVWKNKTVNYLDPRTRPLSPSIWQFKGEKKSIIAVDFGIKYNILRSLSDSGCEVVVVPAQLNADNIKALEPDGIFLSNGPGDPEPVQYAVEAVKELIGYRPIFGICLGHQILALALGGTTYKLKFGHRGANQPVKNLATGKVEITSQNHGFAVDIASLEKNNVEITHINLNDDTLEGFRHRDYPVFAVQYHPEASPGPHDASYLFEKFINLIQTQS